jgi:hypothetical protein
MLVAPGDGFHDGRRGIVQERTGMSWSTNRIYDNHGRIVVPVEQPHLDFAMQRSSSCCAIAIAVRCAIPDAKFIAVDVMWIKFTRNGKRFRMQTPAIGRECILNLDGGNAAAVTPFVLKLRPEFIPSRPRAELRRKRREGVAPPATPKQKAGAGVSVTSTREHGLRMYKRATAPPPPPRPAPSHPHRPPELTKSELRAEFEKAWSNTAAMQ